MQKITPFLWFDGMAEEAMNFYTSIFKQSRVGNVVRYGDAGPGPKGSVMSATFQLLGQDFYALNGGPMYKFTPAISFFVNCETQDEVDNLWDKLSEGGQVLQDKDSQKSTRVMQAMLKMIKLDIGLLQKAYDGT